LLQLAPCDFALELDSAPQDKGTQIDLPLFVGLDALTWFIGVLFIRFAGTMFFVEGSLWLVGLYLLTIPVVWLTIESVARIGLLINWNCSPIPNPNFINNGDRYY
jgi:hypothetical protein